MSTPRYTYTTVNGVRVLTREEWNLNGQYHRIDGPAYQLWQVVDGVVFLTRERWYLNGRPHRTDGPALREWQVVDGHTVLIHEEWYLNGLRHRTDGPAHQHWWVVKNEILLIKEGWHLKGVKIHPRILRQPVRAIERWWQFQRSRRQQAIEESLWENGMTVFPGFMGLLKEY